MNRRFPSRRSVLLKKREIPKSVRAKPEKRKAVPSLRFGLKDVSLERGDGSPRLFAGCCCGRSS